MLSAIFRPFGVWLAPPLARLVQFKWQFRFPTDRLTPVWQSIFALKAQPTKLPLVQTEPTLELALQAERAAIARDLHDEMGAILMALKIDLKLASKQTNESALQEHWIILSDRVDQAFATVARVSENLRCTKIEHVGLWNAIDHYAIQFEALSKIQCKVSIQGEENSPCKTQVHDLFRIVQEALTNVARHAKASTVNIDIFMNQERYEMKITDNGTGVCPHHLLDASSFGLLGMYERAKVLGGQLQINASPVGGTVVSFEMPLRARL